MSKSKLGKLKKLPVRGRAVVNSQPSAAGALGIEKMFADIYKLMQEKQFESVEEANEFLQSALGSSGGSALFSEREQSAKERAEDLVYDAWETSGQRRVQLACKALALFNDCASAYVLLAHEAANLLESKDLYEKGMKAAERTIGKESFENSVGHFWGVFETRPYMRARQGFAYCLWLLGERAEAIEHYFEMLHLNPSDNQGIRYVLTDCLLAEKFHEKLEKLLSQYDDDGTACWAYTKALLYFRKNGDSKESKSALREALKTNHFVPPFLIGQKPIPKESPEVIGFGDEREAEAFVVSAIDNWRATPGAITWLTGVYKG